MDNGTSIKEVMKGMQDYLYMNISNYKGKPMSDEALVVYINQALLEIYSMLLINKEQAIIAVPKEARVFTLEGNDDPNITYTDKDGNTHMRLAKDPNVILGTIKQARENEYGKAIQARDEESNQVMKKLVNDYDFKR
jgi:hypothetical protein